MDDLDEYLKAYREYLRAPPPEDKERIDERIDRLLKTAKYLYLNQLNKAYEPDVEVPDVFLDSFKE